MNGISGYRDNAGPAWDRGAAADPAEAEDFLRLFYAEAPPGDSLDDRLAAVCTEIARTGTYTHTTEELTFGARVAWRNASRCIGRLYWQSMVVLDRRSATTTGQIFDGLLSHLRTAGGWRDDGLAPTQLRPVISVFAPARPGHPYARIWNDQLIRYAGYRRPGGGVVGDPRYVDFTAAMARRGWTGKGESFDVLPLAIESPDEGVRLYELPEQAVLEVPIAHPEHPWFAAFGLRWHAVPAIANMRLSIGGVDYPTAPFNGWYMGAEIGARNLADADRYDMLPRVAAALGLDTTRESSLWRDRALVELNIAVLWSFERAGVKVSDHHTESRRFLTHLDREERAGRVTPADWSWIVPPISGGTTPVFHRYYTEADQRPNFYLDDEARDLGRTGEPGLSSGATAAGGCPYTASAGDAPPRSAGFRVPAQRRPPAEPPAAPRREPGSGTPRIRPAVPVRRG